MHRKRSKRELGLMDIIGAKTTMEIEGVIIEPEQAVGGMLLFNSLADDKARELAEEISFETFLRVAWEYTQGRVRESRYLRGY